MFIRELVERLFSERKESKLSWNGHPISKESLKWSPCQHAKAGSVNSNQVAIYKLFNSNKGKILEEEVTEKITEDVTEGVMDGSGEEETPISGVGTFMTGYLIGVLVPKNISISNFTIL